MSKGETGHTGPVGPSRRAFLQQIPAAVAGTTCASAFLSLAGCATASRYVKTSVSPEGKLLVRRADLGSATSVLLHWSESNIPIILHRSASQAASETWTAVWARCTHRGCEIEIGADRLSCPCHGSEFAFEGAVLKGPAQAPLVRFTVTPSDEYLVLQRVEGNA
jgi:cytochrome b6-f complex iron-sulfur subunit